MGVGRRQVAVAVTVILVAVVYVFINNAATSLSLAYSIILAVIQGLTEFLPISSSGHLAAVQLIWPAMQFPGELFEVSVHLGTTAAVLFYYRHLLVKILRGQLDNRIVDGLFSRQWAAYIILASIPTAAIGLGFENLIRGAFQRLDLIALCLALSGIVLMTTSFVARREYTITPLLAIAIGTIQGAAILPGISRSGLTISLALLFGVAHRQAVTFSFLLSVPAILGATLLEGLNFHETITGTEILFANLAFATLSAGAIGYICIGLVHRATSEKWWHRFAWYLWALSAVLAWLALGSS
ncbi:MAG: undecaprenyl-diphosphate phosphatase [Acidobacteriota bacterium]|nr:undecaprenyl-diphosphate phosphatase [Acidobacteriota bacterium]